MQGTLTFQSLAEFSIRQHADGYVVVAQGRNMDGDPRSVVLAWFMDEQEAREAKHMLEWWS